MEFETYQWLKVLHIVAVISWMAGLFYLPRLFVYHTQVAPGSETSELFKVMERRLLNAIMHPAMVVSVVVGLILFIELDAWHQGWVHIKLTFAAIMVAFHFYLAKCRTAFKDDKNQKSEKFYRMINEIPTLGMIVIVIMVIVKPF